MIYNSTVTSVNESDIMSLLENAEDRFEDYTIAEATAITVAEQEENWTRFMKGIGLSELSTVMEGQEVIYEGARLSKFVEKAKAYFKMALSKLAEITKSFVTKIEQFVKSNDSFVKKYEKDLKGKKLDEFKGYRFDHMKVPDYSNGAITQVKFDGGSNIGTILANRDSDYSKEAAENALFKGGAPSGNSLSEKLTVYFYGAKEKETLKNVSADEQLNVLKNTKNLKKEASESYKKAAKEIKDIIKKIDEAGKKFSKDNDKELRDAQRIDSAFNVLLSYWKTYSSAAHQMHGAYMRALGARNRQAKAICTKLITGGLKEKGKADRKEIKDKLESGFVNTDAFLGAVEFI